MTHQTRSVWYPTPKPDDPDWTGPRLSAKYEIRPALDTDEGFIASGYVQTARQCMPRGQVTRMPDGAFHDYHYSVVRRLIKRCGAKVACHPDEQDRLFGFSITENQTVHMVYVSKSHWRLGIGKELLKGVSVSEMIFRLWPNTQHGSETAWLWNKIENLKYLPYWMEINDG